MGLIFNTRSVAHTSSSYQRSLEPGFRRDALVAFTDPGTTHLGAEIWESLH